MSLQEEQKVEETTEIEKPLAAKSVGKKRRHSSSAAADPLVNPHKKQKRH